MTRAIEMVPFHGDMLQATRDEGGVWVALRPMCEALGLDTDSQRKKLRGKAWACTVLNAVHDASGRRQEMSLLSLDSVPMWLATIEASRVAPAVRPKLARYQCEAARVLAAHFLPPAPPAAAVLPDPVVAHGARIGDSAETRDDLQRYCALAAKAPGWTIRLIHGLIRRRHRISSPYYLGLVFWPSMRDELHEIALGKVVRALPPRLRVVKPASVTQLVIPGTSSS